MKKIKDPIIVTNTSFPEILNHYTSRTNYFPKTKIKNEQRLKNILAASGQEFIGEVDIREVADPLGPTVRDQLTSTAYGDPTLFPAIRKRVDASFEDGYELILEKNEDMVEDAQGDGQDTPANAQQNGQGTELVPQITVPEQYNKALKMLKSWCKKHNMLGIFRSANAGTIIQGRSATRFYPAIQDLQVGTLPIMIEPVASENMSTVYVDVGLTRKVVELKTNFQKDQTISADEMIYIVRSDWGLRDDFRFYGVSMIEVVLRISQTLRRIYNRDFPEAAIMSYLTKIIFKLDADGTPEEQKSKFAAFLSEFLNTDNTAFATNQETLDIKEVRPSVDMNMLDMVEKKLYQILVTQIEVPESMLNRTGQINRDTATIQAIQFIKFVRKPDEVFIATEFENQFFNPILARMLDTDVDKLAYKIRVIANDPPENAYDNIGTKNSSPEFDNLAEKKTQEIQNEDMQQTDSQQEIFGATGFNVKEKDDGTYDVKPISRS